MDNINYNVFDMLSKLVIEDKSIDEISHILNLEKSFVSTLLKRVRNEYILEFDENNYKYVFKIDKLLHKKKKNRIINNFGGKKDIIFNLICDGKSSTEICNLLGISSEGYINFLKYMFYEIYLYGNIDEKVYLSVIRRAIIECYKELKSNIVVHTKKGEINIVPSIMRLRGLNDEVIMTESPISSLTNIECDNNFKFVVISDLHVGSVFENIDYVKMVYDEATKYDISDIFVSGDVVEGCHANYARCHREYSSTIEQVNHLLKDYPYDKNIKNHILLGNHEAFPIIVEGYDMFNDLNSRSDFEVSGYRSGYFKIKNEYISLKHEINRVINEITDNVVLFNFLGHSHQYKCNYDGKYVTFRVPTCSDLEGDTSDIIVNKGYLICEVHFDSLGKASELCVIYKDFENKDTEIKFERRLTK